MKKVFLTTTALVAAGAAVSQPCAADGLKLGIAGFYRGAMGIEAGGDSFTGAGFGLGDAGRTSGGFRQEIRLNFTGKTTLDNGLTVGVLVGINGENLFNVGNNTTPSKQAYADFSGKFGDVRFGEANGALRTDCVIDPGNVTANFGVNTPNESFSNAGNGFKTIAGAIANTPNRVGVTWFGSIGTCHGIESRGTKIEYFSPSIAGFTFGVSYTPSGGARNPGGGYFYGTDLNTSKSQNVVSVGVDYIGKFDGVKLTAGGGGEWATDSHNSAGVRNSENPSWYQGGFQLGFANGFAIGASGAYMVNYKEANYKATDAGPSDDGWLVSAGASYSIEAWKFGLQGIYSKWEVFSGAGHDDIYGASFNVAYLLGPGIQLEGQVAYSKYDANSLAAPSKSEPIDYDAVEFDAGFAINF
jgi:outer membrane protein OmpU